MEMNSIFYEVLELMKLYKPRANNRMFTVFFYLYQADFLQHDLIQGECIYLL